LVGSDAMRIFCLPTVVGIVFSLVLIHGSASLVRGQIGSDVLSYHGTTLVTGTGATIDSSGVNSTEQALTPGNIGVAGFGKQFSRDITDTVDITGIPASDLPLGNAAYTARNGQVYAQPLVETNVTVNINGTPSVHDVVFVATSMDSLYAIDANNGIVLWKDSFLSSGVTPVPGGTGSEINSSDIQPWVGIVSTPVIDANSGQNGFLYLVAKTREVVGGQNGDQTQPHYVYTLHKINIPDGSDTPTVIADTTLNTTNNTYTYNSPSPYVLGTGDGSVTVNSQSLIYFNAVRQMIRPALQLYNGKIYIASASHGDNGPYHGWILAYDTGGPNALKCTAAWNSTPNGGQGGIWQGGGGVTIDSSGNVYFETGNGTFDGNNNGGNGPVTGLITTPGNTNGLPANGDYGDCFVKLTADNTTEGSQGSNPNGFGLTVADYFCPHNQDTLNSGDQDLGSGGPVLLPDSDGSVAHPHLLVGGGKQGTLYLIDRDNMGKFGTTDNVVQSIPNAINALFSVPAFFNGRLYVTPTNGSIVSWPVANAAIDTSNQQNGGDTFGLPGGSPYISANGTSNGIVWVTDYVSSELRAYDATNLTSELWTSDLNPSRDALSANSDSAVKFAVPVPVNGRVYVGTANNLVAYGPVVAPTPPTNLTAVTTGPTSTFLIWSDPPNNNESEFLVERSPDNVTFTQIGTTGPNVNYYADSNLTAQASYYYRVRAANSFNTLNYSAYTNTSNLTTPASGGVVPVDLYPFDEGTGTSTADSSGLGGNNGTLIGGVVSGTSLPTWVLPGRIGNANLSFSGTGVDLQNGQSAVQLNNDLSPILGKTSSLLFWINIPVGELGNNTHYLAPAVTGVDEINGHNDINWGYLDGSGHIGIAVGDDGTLVSANAINDGNWHHIALTRDSSTGQVSIYVDGALSSSATFTSTTPVKTTPFSLIGAMSLVGSDGDHFTTFQGATFLNAQLDDVQIYNSAVSADFVAAIAVAPLAPSNLIVTPAANTGGTELDLTWTNNATNATGVEVWSSVNNGTFTRIAQLAATATSYANINLTPGTSYLYFVRAVTPAWPANAPNSDSGTVSSTTSITPLAPTPLTATTPTSTEVDLSWTPGDNNATSFKVYRRISPSAFTLITTLSASTTTYPDTAVFSGTTYDYEVIASNIAGDSSPATLTVTTPGAATTTFESYITFYNLTAPENTLTANPANDGVPNLLKYAFNMDPTVNDAANLNPTTTPATGLPLISEQNGSLAISYVQRIPPTDITYTVQVSGDLQAWNSGPNYTTQVSVTNVDMTTNTELVTVQDNVVLGSTPNQRRFIRVQVSK
jgi:hypothetical protein